MKSTWMKLSAGTVAAVALFGMTAGAALANEKVEAASKVDGSWVMYGKDYANTRYSGLKAINTENVKGLKVAFAFQLGALKSSEATPIVIGDTMYLTSSSGPKYVHAINAKTGERKWTYEPEIPEDVGQFTCCDVVNRGVTYADGKIFVGRLDGRLVALDAATGKEVWKQTVVDYKQGSSITSPPLVVKNLVITGFGGGEYGARGNITAYEAATGKQVWRTWTVPGPGEPGNETWKGDSWQYGGGVAWLNGSYDSKTNTVIYGTSNPGPWNAAVRGPGTSDYGNFTNLYTAATLGLDADTGKIKWHLQTTPHDAWDYDGVNEAVLVDLTLDGKKVPTLLKADRNGFFYVANREDGKLISAKTFVPVNWAKGIDPKTARPIEDPVKRPRAGAPAKDICPNLVGGKNWQPMSFNPNTGLVYIPANNVCMDMTDLAVEYKRGAFYLGKEFPTKPGPGGYLGELVAWDPVKQQKAWGVKEKLPFNGGTLTTGGNLVFWGTFDGWFKAFDARNGKQLWKFNVGSGVGAGAMTYSIDGKQYVAVVTGKSTVLPLFLGDVGKQMAASSTEGGTMFVFSQ
jgi:alcohol dehydrogenase (cytochrome c)